jgi:acyl-CoA thioesterase 8
MKSVPSDFNIHSMHCYFVLAGSAGIPVIYHVEHIRSGRSFATRTVQARQRGQVIFTTTMSFVRQNSGGKKLVEHAINMPYVPGPEDDGVDTVQLPGGATAPVISKRIDILNNDSPHPFTKKTRQWIKASDKISEAGGHQAHLACVAYMSDSYFIGTVSRVHKLWRIPAQNKTKSIKDDEDVLKTLRNPDERQNPARASEPRPVVSMMVSLDHSIYFHDPRGFQADEWLFTEMESPWAGDGRGLVYQRIFTKDGKLIASCVQEVSSIALTAALNLNC